LSKTLRCWIDSDVGHFGTRINSAVTTIMWPSNDSTNRRQGMLDGTRTSFQKTAGVEVVAIGGGVRDKTRSARFRKKTRYAGSGSSRSLRRGDLWG